MVRDNLKTASLVVVKVGSRVLLLDDGRPNYPRIAHLVEQMTALHLRNIKVIFVSSGAIGAGMEALGLKKRPNDLPTLQAAAAIGQVRLMRTYEDLFGRSGLLAAQVLLTHDDLKNRTRHLNIKNTLSALLERGVIPIINENDTVSVDEIKFGDNDVLASLVAMLCEAKALILLTTAQGFMIKKENGEEQCLSHIIELNEEVLKHIEAHKVGLSVGGMKSKLLAASNMIHVGGIAVIAPGTENNVLGQIFAGENIGTVVGDNSKEQAQRMPGRKRWIAFYHRPRGAVYVDDGAKMALLNKGKSLLPVGIKMVDGHFQKGSVIEIRDQGGNGFAKGIAQMDSTEIETVKGKASGLFKPSVLEVVHRDDLVILHEGI
ncbi:MAG TPA: glutamate 5-kinase [Myxococcota bacterium]|nr:glutamate 5-kinase [Myxococcota bacterium]